MAKFTFDATLLVTITVNAESLEAAEAEVCERLATGSLSTGYYTDEDDDTGTRKEEVLDTILHEAPMLAREE